MDMIGDLLRLTIEAARLAVRCTAGRLFGAADEAEFIPQLVAALLLLLCGFAAAVLAGLAVLA
ncbi:MAG TPA: hypothetical protein VGE52_02010 [Pirellulales bacterium]